MSNSRCKEDLVSQDTYSEIENQARLEVARTRFTELNIVTTPIFRATFDAVVFELDRTLTLISVIKLNKFNPKDYKIPERLEEIVGDIEKLSFLFESLGVIAKKNVDEFETIQKKELDKKSSKGIKALFKQRSLVSLQYNHIIEEL
eukprot:gene1422-1649_t